MIKKAALVVVFMAGDIARRVDARAAVALARVAIEADEPPRTFPPRDGAFVKNRFRAALGFEPF